MQFLANTLYSDRYNNLYPVSVRTEWRVRDLLSWFHPYSWLNKMAYAVTPATGNSLFQHFAVGCFIGVLIAAMVPQLRLWKLIALQLIFMFLIVRPDYLTGSPIVSFITDFLISVGMVIAFLCLRQRFVPAKS